MLQRFRSIRPLAALLAAALALPLAQPLAALADDGAAPANAGNGVARLSVVDGTVSIQRGDSGDAVAAVNAPILAADYVTTGPESRAEIEYDGKTAVRLGENVQMRFSHIDDGNREIQLAAGTIDLRLLRGTDGSNAIDTPSVSIVPRAAGSYRVAVSDDGTTFVSVRSGRADIETPQGAQSVAPGTTIIARGTASNPHIDTSDAIAFDRFDAFNEDRDREQLAALGNPSYVDPDIGGVADLNANGNWVDDGSYGHVWIPTTVAAGWAPYRSGSWVWGGSYGWTWVGAEPWGWAPYHYGRWYFSSAYNRWAWYPPAPAAFVPAWSPALVGFVGLTIGAVNVGVGFGSHIGWVPLAPFEAFHPWWGPHAAAFGAGVAWNGGSAGAGYRNARYDGVSSVSVQNFRAGRFGGTAVVTSAQLGGYHPVQVQGALPFAPTPSTMRYTQHGTAGLPPERTAYGQPSYGQPSYRQPAYAQPSYGQASYGQPSYGQPSYARATAPSYARSAVTPSYERPFYQQRASSAYDRPSYQQASPANSGYRGYAQRGAPAQSQAPARERGSQGYQREGRYRN